MRKKKIETVSSPFLGQSKNRFFSFPQPNLKSFFSEQSGSVKGG